LVRGQAGDAMGFEQSGGVVLLLGPTGHRAGLRMKGGTLIVIRSTGRLLGERQCGGDIFASTDRVGPFPGHGRLGGSLHRFIAPSELDARAKMILRTALRAFLPHLESTPVPSLEETCAP
jgi:glutamate synthase domain-containing protein 3